MAVITKYETRADRIERTLHNTLHKPVPGIKYKMPDGSWRILPHNHRGFGDALSHIDSPEARIVLHAVTDSNNNNGATLQLLWAVMHPVDTGPDSPAQTELYKDLVQQDNTPVTAAQS